MSRIEDSWQIAFGTWVIIGDKQFFEGTIFLIYGDAEVAKLVIGSYFLAEPIDYAQ